MGKVRCGRQETAGRSGNRWRLRLWRQRSPWYLAGKRVVRTATIQGRQEGGHGRKGSGVRRGEAGHWKFFFDSSSRVAFFRLVPFSWHHPPNRRIVFLW